MPDTDFPALFKDTAHKYCMELLSNIQYTICPDQHVGNIFDYNINNKEKDFTTRNNMPVTFPQAPVILILESPHIQEYQSPDNPVPANGPTGTNIRKNMDRVLGMLESPIADDRPLVLMNAIRHQCSAGVTPKHHRDALFTRMWEQEEVVANFRERLESYIQGCRDPLIINACTKGNCKLELRLIVEDEIRKVRPQGSDLKITHPSSWIPKAKGAPPHIGRWEYP